MPRWRIGLHALDRTGPPVLARSFLRWLATEHPDQHVEVVAFRGGPLEEELAELGPVRVLLDPHEPWDHAAPDPERVRVVRRRAATLEPADAMLLVSIAAGQCLAYLPEPRPPVVTWTVEQGEDLHWFDSPVDLRGSTHTWLAGSDGTAAALRQLPDGPIEARVVPEFIERPAPVEPALVAERRAALGATDGTLVVMAAGIGTWRKAPDLFLEVVLAARRAGLPALGVWIGGQDDPLHPLVTEEARRLGLDELRFVDSVADIDAWLAGADVLVHAARLDAFPLVCLHAAAVGTLVVAFEGVGGVPEMFGPSFLGVPYPDVSGLAALLGELADPAVRERHAAAQQARVLDRYVADAAAPRLLDRLAAAAQGAGVPHG